MASPSALMDLCNSTNLSEEKELTRPSNGRDLSNSPIHIRRVFPLLGEPGEIITILASIRVIWAISVRLCPAAVRRTGSEPNKESSLESQLVVTFDSLDASTSIEHTGTTSLYHPTISPIPTRLPEQFMGGNNHFSSEVFDVAIAARVPPFRMGKAGARVPLSLRSVGPLLEQNSVRVELGYFDYTHSLKLAPLKRPRKGTSLEEKERVAVPCGEQRINSKLEALSVLDGGDSGLPSTSQQARIDGYPKEFPDLFDIQPMRSTRRNCGVQRTSNFLPPCRASKRDSMLVTQGFEMRKINNPHQSFDQASITNANFPAAPQHHVRQSLLTSANQVTLVTAPGNSSPPALVRFRHPLWDTKAPPLSSSLAGLAMSDLAPDSIGQATNALAPAKLMIEGDLSDMASGWSDEERHGGRRLVQFWRKLTSNTIYTTFQPIHAKEYKQYSTVISCIFLEHVKECFVTSADIIHLFEALVGEKLGPGEKIRIRRDLEFLEPFTVKKREEATKHCFALTMSFSEPKPRNMERDFKIFLWRFLEIALHKLINKYAVVRSDGGPY